MKFLVLTIYGVGLLSFSAAAQSPHTGDKRGWPNSWLPLRWPGSGHDAPQHVQLPSSAAGPSVSSLTSCSCLPPGYVSLEVKLRLIAQDHDHDGDGLVTRRDFHNLAAERYGASDDGEVDEEECVRERVCRYGDTEQVAQFVCALILQGEDSVRLSAFNTPPFSKFFFFETPPYTGKGLPLQNFSAAERKRYETFVAYRCANRPLTTEEKLTKNAANNDFNNDGVVTSEDVEHDLTSLYDFNKDGNVTKAEWVSRWVCNYADTGDYARFMWDEITASQPVAAVAIKNLAKLFEKPLSTEQFKSANRQRYERFRTSTLDRYLKNSL